MPNSSLNPYTLPDRKVILLFLAVLLGAAFLSFPFESFADLRQPNQIVTCGFGGPSCRVCDLYDLAHNVIDFLLWTLAMPLMVVALIAGGVVWLTSAGSQQRVELGRKILFSAVIGFLIAFAAWVIVNTILSTLVFKNPFDGRVWSDYSFCKDAPFGGGTEPPPDGEPPPLTDPEIEEIVEELEERMEEGEFSESDATDQPVEIPEDLLYDPELEEPLLEDINPEIDTKVEAGSITKTEFEKLREELDKNIELMGPEVQKLKKTNIILVDKEKFNEIYEENFPDALKERRQKWISAALKAGLTREEAERRFQDYQATDFNVGFAAVETEFGKAKLVVVCTCAATAEADGYGGRGLNTAIIHEVTHAAVQQKFEDFKGDAAAVGIYNRAKALDGKSFSRGYAGTDAAEMLAETASAYIVSGGTFRPKNAPPGTPAGNNWDEQVGWLKKNGIIK